MGLTFIIVYVVSQYSINCMIIKELFDLCKNKEN